MKIIYYEPVVKPVRGDCFTVNGAFNLDRDEAIRLAMKHCAFREKGTIIVRVDEIESYDN